jgi:hypothetical protein
MVYDGTKHSCFNDRGGTHNPAAEDAWRRPIAFFEEHVTRGRRHARSGHPTLSTRFRPKKQHPPRRLPIRAGAASGARILARVDFLATFSEAKIETAMIGRNLIQIM